MKKIVIISSYAPSLLNFRGDLIKELKNQGHHVSLVFPDEKYDLSTKKGLESTHCDLYTYRLKRTSKNILFDLFSLIQLVSIIKTIKPDTVLSYTIKPVIYGSIAAQICGVKNNFSLITGLGYAFSKPGGLSLRVATFLYKIALSRSKSIIFQNEDDKNLFIEKKIIKRTKKTFVVNGSGVNVDFFAENKISNFNNFLFIGRLLKAKGVTDYVEAAKIVKQKHPDAIFNVVGWIDNNPDSIKEETLNKWIDEGIINFIGKLQDVRKALISCSVFILPSYREGMPRTVLEAMSIGRPIITTDAPGCRDTVINGFNGYLVPVCSPESIAEKVIYFIKNTNLMLEMASNSRHLAVNKYEISYVNKQMLEAMEL